ncbi:hypothetical protein AKJ16_DCAP22551 [Drosera capensis]
MAVSIAIEHSPESNHLRVVILLVLEKIEGLMIVLWLLILFAASQGALFCLKKFRKIILACVPILLIIMHLSRQPFSLLRRSLYAAAHDSPSETIKKKTSEREKLRKAKKLKKNELFVQVPESRSFLDTATMPMILTAVGVSVFAKLLMMYDDSRSQEMIKRKIKNGPPGQGTVRMLFHQEWEEIWEVRPRTPFESMLARPSAKIRTRPSAKIRTGEPEDVKDWTIGVYMDAVTRVEDCMRRSSR